MLWVANAHLFGCVVTANNEHAAMLVKISAPAKVPHQY